MDFLYTHSIIDYSLLLAVHEGRPGEDEGEGDRHDVEEERGEAPEVVE